MPKATEFSIHLDDRPGTLAKFCTALADRGVNILAFESFEGGEVRLVVDTPTTAKTVMNDQRIACTEKEVAQLRLSVNRPGELARAASRLGEANININYAYVGIEPKTNSPLVIFGVKDVSKAAPILDELAQKAA
jgi:hypothetical protein